MTRTLAALALLLAVTSTSAQQTDVGSAIETDYYRCQIVDPHEIQCVPITNECAAQRPADVQKKVNDSRGKKITVPDNELKEAAPRDPLCWPITHGRVERRR